MGLNLRGFNENPEIGKSTKQTERELRQVAASTRKRVVNNNTTEDHDTRAANLRDARGSNN